MSAAAAATADAKASGAAATVPLPAMPSTLEGIIPILPAISMADTLAFWRKLGFELVTDHGDYAIVRVPNQPKGVSAEVHFSTCSPDLDPKKNEFQMYIRVTSDVDGWARALGRTASDKPWGMREVHVVDPNGNCIKWGQRIVKPAATAAAATDAQAAAK